MLKNKRLLFLLVLLVTLGSVNAYAQMTDEQIITYVSEGVAAGKSERQIGTELISRGVSTTQLQRILREYHSGAYKSTVDENSTRKLSQSRSERKVSESDETAVASKAEEKVKGKSENEDKTQKDQKAEIVVDGKKIIYGHDIFSADKLTFEPNQNAATPEDYVLGPGDEIVIDIWGVNEATIRQKISPEGRIIVSQVGPIQLSGLTVKEAKGKIKAAFKRMYSSLSSGSSQLSVTLGDLRTIQVNVLGEVKVPGTYRLSSFSTLFNAIYRAGGITEIGSLRNVKVVRGGEEFAVVDIYDYLFGGKLESNVSLKEGDVILVPPYSALVSIEGNVKRPMYYEVKDGEPVSGIISYAGGFTGNAYSGSVNVERNDGRTNHIYTVKSSDFGTFALKDGDAVSVSGSEVETFTNRIEVKGAVYRPGVFELGNDIASVKQLVSHAGGLLEDAFTGRAQIIREKSDRSLELLSIPLKGILDGTEPDVALRRNDILMIANINDIETKGDLTITGYVLNPGKYQYAEHTTVEDLILLAGGLDEGASSANVEVSRRIIDPTSTTAGESLSTVYTLTIKDGLIEDGAGGFELAPFDVVSVRKSPGYVEQKIVSIVGEVNFPGEYALVSNNERVSDLVKRAGGATLNGNVHGAILKRKINEYERNVRQNLIDLADQTASKTDTLVLDRNLIEDIYTVGLELDKAIAKPGSDYDVVLRDGDELIIPEKSSTVRIQGEVLYPNTVHYISGKSVSYYINQAGGYNNKARRSKVYVIYMNGTVDSGSFAKVEPGCVIVVPAKNEKNKMTTAELLSVGTTTASITTMIATVVSLFIKK